MSFPGTMVVFVYFWSAYFIDPKLINAGEEFKPFWLNLVEHGLILPVALMNITRAPFDMVLVPSVGMFRGRKRFCKNPQKKYESDISAISWL